MDANVFISWSGARAKHIATVLRRWLPSVIQHSRPWMSEEDIDPGTRWASELARKLESMKFGIVCLTPEAANNPWVLFETGALTKALNESVVCPYLFDMSVDNLQGPMSQFNSVVADRQGTWRMVRSLNKSLDQELRLSDARLEEAFKKWWPDLQAGLDETEKQPPGRSVLFSGVSNIGLGFVYLNRGPALERFREQLEDEIERARTNEDASISFVSTSMRGFLIPKIARFDGQDIISKAIEHKCQLRILMVHPETAELRARSEGRGRGDITDDIHLSLNLLRGMNVPRDSVRYYRMGPTAFGIATSDSMLLNAYPAASESQRCFSIIVHKTQLPTDIYQQYKQNHFDALWESYSEPVPESEWEPNGKKKRHTQKRSGRKRRTTS